MRKAVLLVDDSQESSNAKNLLKASNLEYVEYHIKKFEESCCGEIPTTRAPSIFAPDGVYKGIDGVKRYVEIMNDYEEKESESAYW
ncbi:MAG: hypothetical protein ACREBI_00015 [Nitrosotalea sp.]